ncbi:MAG TPA: hypothetical protein VMY05_09070 [Acidobacteriota bacterium]|nr:hypothetical protein [Acidobacteriota bacterium]
MTNRRGRISILIMGTVLAVMYGLADASTVRSSVFDRGLQEIRVAYSASALAAQDVDVGDQAGGESVKVGAASGLKRRSPAKAFALSLAVPGLGQYYLGSRVKSVLFFGAEIAVWTLHFTWLADGGDKTDLFEAYADTYWGGSRYVYFLETVYGVSNDHELDPGEPGMTHNLPDTKTQQYYEMIGKYDQFGWGWADAYANGNPGDTVNSTTYSLQPIDVVKPDSPLRDKYEDMRHDANRTLDRANKMIMVSMANRLISAFEAYFAAKSANSRIREQDSEFGRIGVKAQLCSYTSFNDTPFLKVSYRF